MRLGREAGAVAVGCAAAGPVTAEVIKAYREWLAAGRHGSMAYLERYDDVRFDPRRLLPGAKTVISFAFPYRPCGGYHHPHISDYALGEDYHIVLRERLAPVTDYICGQCGAQARICVDTAPVIERYWAERAGVGFRGLNRLLIVPGAGSGVFLAEIVTTLELVPDTPLSENSCEQCGKCVKACPGQALCEGFDARKCRSYLSIEHRGELPDGVSLGQCVYGCDICQRVCPYNAGEPPEPLEEFIADPRLLSLDRRALGNLTSGDWRRLAKRSAMRRVGLAQIKRNLGHK